MAKHSDENESGASVPSTLDLDGRDRSGAKAGGKKADALQQELTHTGATIAGGDPDADAQSAYLVGDEAPGGDNPTPDQNIVQEIGEAVGLQYEDTEPLGGERKFEERDRRRWELDSASSDDYEERQRK